MAKYYVQSGSFKMVMSAADTQAAALWLVHCALNDVLPAYDDPTLTEEDRCEIVIMQGLLKLDNTIAISEQGFDRNDSLEFDVLEIISDWHQLMSALLRFESDQNLI